MSPVRDTLEDTQRQQAAAMTTTQTFGNQTFINATIWSIAQKCRSYV